MGVVLTTPAPLRLDIFGFKYYAQGGNASQQFRTKLVALKRHLGAVKIPKVAKL